MNERCAKYGLRCWNAPLQLYDIEGIRYCYFEGNDDCTEVLIKEVRKGPEAIVKMLTAIRAYNESKRKTTKR